MEALSPFPPSPSSSSSVTSSRRSSKRSASPTEDSHVYDDDQGTMAPPPKKRAARSTAAEKAAKKAARMERNRIAAQASRDRKKNQTEILEARVAELEEQLATASTPSSSSFSPSHSHSPFVAALPALPPTFSLVAPPSPEAAQLREENEALKTQLALEKLQSQSLQIRLSSLEAKFGRLEQLLSGGGMADAQQQSNPVQVHVQQQVEQQKKEDTTTSMTEQDSLRLVAAEAGLPVVDSLSLPFDSLPPSASFDLNLDLSFADAFASTASGLDLDLGPLASDAARDSLVDQGHPVGGASQHDLVKAWNDWASHLDVAPLEQPSFDLDPQAGEEFDLFEFLRQDVGAGTAVEAVC